MKPSHQKDMMFGVIENIPTISFFALLHLTGDPRIAGWCGSLLAAIVVALYVRNKLKPHSILLGINLYILASTPAIDLLISLDQFWLAEAMIAGAQSGVLIAIFVIGCVLTVTSKSGFVGAPMETRKPVLLYSGILLLVSLMAIIWSLSIDGTRMLEIGIPLIALFGTRQFLYARLADQQGAGVDPHATVVASTNLHSQESDLLA